MLIIFGLSCSNSSKKLPPSISDLRSLAYPTEYAISDNGEHLAYVVGDSLFFHDIKKGNIKTIFGNMRRSSSYATPFIEWSPDNNSILFTDNKDRIYVANIREEITKPLLADSMHNLLITRQNLFMYGGHWSPNGQAITFPAVNKNSIAQLYSVDLKTGRLEVLTNSDQNVLDHSWSRDGKLVYSKNGFPKKEASLILLNTETMSEKVFYNDKTALYNNLKWSPDGLKLFAQDRFLNSYIFQSNFDGKEFQVLAKLPLMYYSGWFPNSEALMGWIPSGISNKLKKVSIDSLSMKEIDTPPGTIIPIFLNKEAEGNKLFYLLESGNTFPGVYSSYLDGGNNKFIDQERLIPEPKKISSLYLPDYEIISWVSNEKDLKGMLFLPNPKTKKPVPLVIIPYSNTYRDDFPKLDYFLEIGIPYLTARGYAVALPNNSGGTDSRRTDKEYGQRELIDVLSFKRKLDSHPKIDSAKTAVIGHSHGATMAYFFSTHSNTFDAIIGINGATDWIYQANNEPGKMYGFPIGMGGMPNELPEKYIEYSPLANVGDVTSRLLLISGTLDTQIPAIHAEKFFDSLRYYGKNVDSLVFKNEGHLIEKEKNQERLWNEIYSFLENSFR